jgi:hypothetical protein
MNNQPRPTPAIVLRQLAHVTRVSLALDRLIAEYKRAALDFRPTRATSTWIVRANSGSRLSKWTRPS